MNSIARDRVVRWAGASVVRKGAYERSYIIRLERFEGGPIEVVAGTPFAGGGARFDYGLIDGFARFIGRLSPDVYNTLYVKCGMDHQKTVTSLWGSYIPTRLDFYNHRFEARKDIAERALSEFLGEGFTHA